MKRAFKKAEQVSVSEVKKIYLLYFNKYKNNGNKLAKLAYFLYNRASELEIPGDKQKSKLYNNLFLKCNEYYITNFTDCLDNYYDLF